MSSPDSVPTQLVTLEETMQEKLEIFEKRLHGITEIFTEAVKNEKETKGKFLEDAE